MKKLTAFILAALMLCSMLCVTGCSPKTSVTADDFRTLMEAKGATVGDSSDSFAENESIIHVYVAVLSNGEYQIDFYETDTPQSAKYLFGEYKATFEKYKGNVSSQSNVSAANYSSYKLTTDGYYRVLSRINNTLLYVNVKDEYKGEINAILKEIGY